MASLTHTHYTPHDKNGFIKLFIALRFFSVPSFHTRTKVQFLNKMRLLMKTFKITYLNFPGKNEAFFKRIETMVVKKLSLVPMWTVASITSMLDLARRLDLVFCSSMRLVLVVSAKSLKRDPNISKHCET